MRHTPKIVLVAFLLAAFARPSAALSPPDDASLASWRTACATGGHLRISTRDDAFETAHASLEPAGVRVKSANRTAFAAFDYDSEHEQHLPWDAVQRIEVERGHHGAQGFVTGALIGGAVGVALDLAVASSLSGKLAAWGASGSLGPAYTKMAVGSAAIGGVIGLAMGSSASHWHQVAP